MTTKNRWTVSCALAKKTSFSFLKIEIDYEWKCWLCRWMPRMCAENPFAYTSRVDIGAVRTDSWLPLSGLTVDKVWQRPSKSFCCSFWQWFALCCRQCCENCPALYRPIYATVPIIQCTSIPSLIQMTYTRGIHGLGLLTWPPALLHWLRPCLYAKIFWSHKCCRVIFVLRWFR